MKATFNMELPNLTVCLCDEDRERLDTIIDLLKVNEDAAVQRVKDLFPQETAEAVAPLKPFPTEAAPANPQPAQEPPKPAEPKELPPAEPKAETGANQSAPEVTAADLQSKVVQLVSQGKKEETRAIIMEYAPRVGDIPAEKRAEVLERLNALEG